MSISIFRKTILLVPCGGLFIYILLRAYFLSFTHDESLSYTIISGIPTHENTANNHPFNTNLMGLSHTLFGSHEFALRLPNIFSCILFFGACYFIINSSKNIFLYIFGSAILLFNPFLIDFFSLARGYGLSMGFLMLSLYFLLNNSLCHSNQKVFIKNFILSLTFAGLALYSNLVMINYYIACVIIHIAVFTLFITKNANTSARSKFVFIFLIAISLFPLFFGIKQLLFLHDLNALYFGADTLSGLIDSLVDASLYFVSYPSWVPVLLKYCIILSIISGIISMIVKRDFFGKFGLVIYLFILLIAGIILENFLFSAKYPYERSALFFIPIFGLFIYYFIIHILAFYNPSNKIIQSVILGISTLIIFNFVGGANLTYTKSWFYDAHTKNAMEILELETRSLDSKATISNHWLFEPAINYYIESRTLKLNPADRDGVNLESDYIYRLDDNSALKNYTLSVEYKDTNASLFIRMKPDK